MGRIRIILAAVVLCTAMLLGACGTGGERKVTIRKESAEASGSGTQTVTATPAPAEQSSSKDAAKGIVNMDVRQLEGVYIEESGHVGMIRLMAKDDKTVRIFIDWADRTQGEPHWEMTGIYDPEKRELLYTDAIMTRTAYAQNGKKETSTVYTQGSGSFSVSGARLTWNDDQKESIGGQNSFKYEMSLELYQQKQNSSAALKPTATPVPVPTPIDARPVATVTAEPVTPTPSPTPSPMPEPTAGPTAVPEPTAEPIPEPTAEPIPEPTAELIPEPTAEPVPEPTAEPVPEPTAEPVPEPTAEPVPEPTAEPIPEPTAEPVPEPTAEPIPEPTAEPVPEPTEEPIPEPTEEPILESTEEPIPEPTEEPVPEPIEEPILESGVWAEAGDLSEAEDASGVMLDEGIWNALPEDIYPVQYRYQAGAILISFSNDDATATLKIGKSGILTTDDLADDDGWYDEEWDAAAQNATVHCKGSGGMVNVGTFEIDGVRYAVIYHQGDGAGLSEEQILSIADSI